MTGCVVTSFTRAPRKYTVRPSRRLFTYSSAVLRGMLTHSAAGSRRTPSPPKYLRLATHILPKKAEPPIRWLGSGAATGADGNISRTHCVRPIGALHWSHGVAGRQRRTLRKADR